MCDNKSHRKMQVNLLQHLFLGLYHWQKKICFSLWFMCFHIWQGKGVFSVWVHEIWSYRWHVITPQNVAMQCASTEIEHLLSCLLKLNAIIYNFFCFRKMRRDTNSIKWAEIWLAKDLLTSPRLFCMVFIYSLAVDCNFPHVLENSEFIQKILYSIWYSLLPHFCL